MDGARLEGASQCSWQRSPELQSGFPDLPPFFLASALSPVPEIETIFQARTTTG